MPSAGNGPILDEGERECGGGRIECVYLQIFFFFFLRIVVVVPPLCKNLIATIEA